MRREKWWWVSLRNRRFRVFEPRIHTEDARKNTDIRVLSIVSVVQFFISFQTESFEIAPLPEQAIVGEVHELSPPEVERNRWRMNSMIAGSVEIIMIAAITSVKWFFTEGRFPKK